MAGRITYYGNTVKNGLVLDLDSANRDSYSRTGTVWNDISGFRNNTTLINGPTFNSDNGGSIVFDGSNEYVKGENTYSDLDGGNKLTISMWIKTTDLLSNRILFHIPRNLTQQQSQVLVFLRTTGVIDVSVSSTSTFTRSNANIITANNWHYVSICFDLSQGTTNQRIRPFVDGIDVFNSSNNIPQTFPTSSGSIWIGEEANGYLSPFLGQISQVTLYNRRLSATEVLQNYNATKGRYL